MALAHVAWVLASNGKRVLILDWDLEAPGLHRYFYPFLDDKELTSSEGIIEFVNEFADAAMTPYAGGTEPPKDWYLPYADILRYANSLKWDFPRPGTLDLIPAGRQGPSYSSRVNSFSWQNFYERLGGGILIEAAKEQMKDEYDYVLVDSRTGVSDTSGICTVQLPDVLVTCFTLNNQGIEGAAAVAASAFDQRARGELRVFPVPMRVEINEKIKLEQRKAYARERFPLSPAHMGEKEREEYWGEVPVPYIPFYAFEEILATFGDRRREAISVLAAAEKLVSHLTDGEVTQGAEVTEAQREMVLA